MDVSTLGFLIVFLISLVIYYSIPNKLKWIALLAFSLAFISTYKIAGLIFVFASAFSIWMAGLKIEKIDHSDYDKAEIKRKKKCILTLAILFNVSVLVVLKYVGFFAGVVLTGGNPFAILIPVGLSYYTLQAVGYILDLYWGRISAEKSYFKILLFLCYFPQMIQGPISRYKDLSYELTIKDHTFSARNIKFGVQLMLFGYFKVLVIGAGAQEFVTNIFYGTSTPYGLSVLLGLILFGIQLYGNFSGGIDIVRGISECFGVILPENFKQPFFSKSLSEHWRRWHMTLGSWVKDYLFYPITLSKPVSKWKKCLKKQVSKKMANKIPIAVTNVLVFILVGIWHGTGTNYMLWGLYNGLILAFSELMADAYVKATGKLHINTHTWAWSLFAMLRTLFIVSLGRSTDCAATASGALNLVGNMFKIGKTNLGIINISANVVVLFLMSVVILLAVDMIHEKNISIREYMERKSFVAQVLFWTIVIQYVPLFRRLAEIGGFLYAGF